MTSAEASRKVQSDPRTVQRWIKAGARSMIRRQCRYGFKTTKLILALKVYILRAISRTFLAQPPCYSRSAGMKRIFWNWVNRRNSISWVSTHSRKPYRRDLVVSDMTSYSTLKTASPKGQETAASKE